MLCFSREPLLTGVSKGDGPIVLAAIEFMTGQRRRPARQRRRPSKQMPTALQASESERLLDPGLWKVAETAEARARTRGR